MEKEILEQYNKVKDILSEEEFLAEMEEIRPNYNDLPLLKIILALAIFHHLKILLVKMMIPLLKKSS